MIGIFLRYVLPLLAIAGAIWWADYGWCNGACKSAKAATVKVQAQLDGEIAKLAKLDKERIAQQERWSQLTAAEEKREKDNDAKRNKVFAGLKDRARHSDSGRTTPIAAPAKRLLGDAYAAAEAAQAAPVPDAAPPADSETVADLITWSVDMLDWAATCKATVEGWQRWYGEISK